MCGCAATLRTHTWFQNSYESSDPLTTGDWISVATHFFQRLIWILASSSSCKLCNKWQRQKPGAAWKCRLAQLWFKSCPKAPIDSVLRSQWYFRYFKLDMFCFFQSTHVMLHPERWRNESLRRVAGTTQDAEATVDWIWSFVVRKLHLSWVIAYLFSNTPGAWRTWYEQYTHVHSLLDWWSLSHAAKHLHISSHLQAVWCTKVSWVHLFFAFCNLWCSTAVLLFHPTCRLGHPKNCLFSSYKKSISRIKVSHKYYILFWKQNHWISISAGNPVFVQLHLIVINRCLALFQSCFCQPSIQSVHTTREPQNLWVFQRFCEPYAVRYMKTPIQPTSSCVRIIFFQYVALYPLKDQSSCTCMKPIIYELAPK